MRRAYVEPFATNAESSQYSGVSTAPYFCLTEAYEGFEVKFFHSLPQHLLRYNCFHPRETVLTKITTPSSGSKNKPIKKPTEAGGKLSLAPASGFLLGLFFSPKNGDGIFLRNSGLFLNCAALQPRRRYSEVFEALHNEQ
jgi:hypothetical protein